MRMLVTALATSLLVVGSAAPGFAQSDRAAVTVLRGGTEPATAANSSGRAMPASNGVTIMTGIPLVSAPQQTAALPGAALAAGNGANLNAGPAAGAMNPSGNTAMSDAAIGAGAGMGGGSIAAPARGAGRAIGGRGGGGLK